MIRALESLTWKGEKRNKTRFSNESLRDDGSIACGRSELNGAERWNVLKHRKLISLHFAGFSQTLKVQQKFSK